MTHKRSEKGQAIILIVFALIGLIAITGLTVDGGVAYSDRRHAQGTVDSAAYAGALAKIRNRDVTAAVNAIASQNGYANDGENSVVTVSFSDAEVGTCPSTGTEILVEITSNSRTFFAPIVGVEQVTNKVSASTRVCDLSGTAPTPLYAGNAIYATKTDACGNGVSDKAVYTGGSSQLQMWGGGLGDASTDPDCMHFPGGNVQLKKAESGSSCANINSAAPNGTGVNYNSISGQNGCGQKIYNVPAPPPPADLNITCSVNAQNIGGGVMNPGNYTGTFPPSGVTTLNPGTYCINGDFKLNANANLRGNGVTIVMNTGGITWNGNMTLNLHGPASGALKGLVIYAPPGNSSKIKMNGSSNVTLVGTMLAQDAPCDFVGSGQIQKVELQMICYTWQMNGNADVQIMYDANNLYTPTNIVMPTISLIR